MTDKPILFSGPMVRAILDGRKTQTRRVLKPLTPVQYEHGITACETPDGARWRLSYATGDRLWVREAWRACSQMDDIKPSEMSQYEPFRYEADGTVRELSCAMIKPGKLRPSMFMPRWASRLTLVVTDVRVQQVQEISSRDVTAEGVEADRDMLRAISSSQSDLSQRCCYHRAHIEPFARLWDSINADRGFGWEKNPWVTALTFTVHRCNIDQMEKAA